MTNREWLNTLDDYHFTVQILAKVAELDIKNTDYEADIWESTNDTTIDFCDWLEEEYKEI